MHKYLAESRSAFSGFCHDVVSTSVLPYSGILMFFPALLVMTTLVAQVEEEPTLWEKRAALDSFCPMTRSILFSQSILNHQLHSGQLILSATLLNLFAGLGFMLSLMEVFSPRLPAALGAGPSGDAALSHAGLYCVDSAVAGLAGDCLRPPD